MEWTFWAIAPAGSSKESPPRISRTAVKALLQFLIILSQLYTGIADSTVSRCFERI
jgi:hypothetical protein